MFHLNARGRQLARPAATPATAAKSLPPALAASVARPVVLAPAAKTLRVAPDAVRKLLRAGNLPAALVVTGPVRLLNGPMSRNRLYVLSAPPWLWLLSYLFSLKGGPRSYQLVVPSVLE
jgi:hypothetical protein